MNLRLGEAAFSSAKERGEKNRHPFRFLGFEGAKRPRSSRSSGMKEKGRLATTRVLVGKAMTVSLIRLHLTIASKGVNVRARLGFGLSNWSILVKDASKGMWVIIGGTHHTRPQGDWRLRCLGRLVSWRKMEKDLRDLF